MPFAVIVAVTLVLTALALVFDREDEPAAPAQLRADSVQRIADRVQAERGLRFAGEPDVRTVTPAQARAEAAGSLDRDLPPARRRAEAQLLAMLGLLDPGFDLGEAALGAFDSAVAGYYDPRSGGLRVIEGAQTGNRVLYETTVAHELTHALEDEHFNFDLSVMSRGGDAALAYTALVEGTATVLMSRYATARFGAEETVGAALASAVAGTGTGNLPPFLTAQLLFPYLAGERFVGRLLAVGGGSWEVVDAALRFRPPASTEQVLHPGKYLRVEQPDRIPRAAAPGWDEVHAGTLGEWLTARVLARAGGIGAADAAAGWGGDSYALLGRREERALVVRWRWDTPRDAREFAGALRAWSDEGMPDSARAGPNAWRGRDGTAVVAERGLEVALAIAPDPAAARRLALAAPGR